MKPGTNRTILYYSLYCNFHFFLNPGSWTPKRILYYSCSAEKISVLLMSAIKDSLPLMSAKEGYWINEIRILGF